MATDKRVQKAGPGSKQIQADGDIHIHEGPSFAEIIEIVESTTVRIVKDYIPEAHLEASAKALQKAEELTSELANRFTDKPDDLIAAFKDPSFNYDWSDATRAALESNDLDVEKIIVDLIEERITRKDSPRTKIVTTAALQAAGRMGEDSRSALALIWWTAMTSPVHNGLPFEWFISLYLARLKRAQEAFTIPRDNSWLEDLDILNLIRLQDSNYSSIGQYFDIAKGHLKPFLVPGIPDSELTRIIEPIRALDSTIDQLVTRHPLKDGFHFIPDETPEKLRTIINAEAREIPEFEELIAMNQFGGVDTIAEGKLREVLSKDEFYRSIEEWWNGQLKPFSLTAPGKVIAYSLTKHHTGPIQNITSLEDVIKV